MRTLNLTLLLKVLYFFPLFLFGIMHFVYPSYFRFLVPEFVPGGIFWVYFSALALSSSSFAIMFNIIPKISIVCLILFVLTFIATVDVPGVLYGNDNFRHVISLFKDVSLLSGTCVYLKSFK